MDSGSPTKWALIALFPLLFLSGEAGVILQNLRKIPISVSSNGASSPITLQPNNATPFPEPYGSSLFFWACDSGDSDCINTQNPTATMAGLSIGNDSISYRLSAEYGYNYPLRIMPLGSCPTITCTARLENCPDELQILDPRGAVTACKPPDCSESAQLCSSYSSLVADSECQTPGSSYEPSSISSNCPASYDLVVSIIGS